MKLWSYNYTAKSKIWSASFGDTLWVSFQKTLWQCGSLLRWLPADRRGYFNQRFSCIGDECLVVNVRGNCMFGWGGKFKFCWFYILYSIQHGDNKIHMQFQSQVGRHNSFLFIFLFFADKWFENSYLYFVCLHLLAKKQKNKHNGLQNYYYVIWVVLLFNKCSCCSFVNPLQPWLRWLQPPTLRTRME